MLLPAVLPWEQKLWKPALQPLLRLLRHRTNVITLHNGGVQVINVSGNDAITGGTGNDSVVATTTQFDANDSFTGGAGTDTIYANNGAAGVGAAVTIGLGATLTGVERIDVLDNSTDANGDVTVTFDAGYVLTTLTIDGSALDASEVLTVNATNNVAAENLSLPAVQQMTSLLSAQVLPTASMAAQVTTPSAS